MINVMEAKCGKFFEKEEVFNPQFTEVKEELKNAQKKYSY